MFFNYLKPSFTSSMEVVLHQAYWSATLSLMCTLLTLPLSSAWTRLTQPRTYQTNALEVHMSTGLCKDDA